MFYWPRLWLLVEKEKKEEVDSAWSVADGFITLSAVSYLGGILWTITAAGAALDLFAIGPARTSLGQTMLLGIVWLGLGYRFYRLSLPFHRQNGEVFKSLFDLYRDRIRSMTGAGPQEIEAWKKAWAYLQLAGHQREIQADRDRKLEAAREQRKNRRQRAA